MASVVFFFLFDQLYCLKERIIIILYNTLFKYIIHKHNTRYVFEKEDREVIPIFYTVSK